MFCRILVAFDGSEPARRALKAAASIAASLKKPLYSVSVVDEVPKYITGAAYGPVDSSTVEDILGHRDAFAKRLVEEVRAAATEAGCEVTAETAVGNIVDVIVDTVGKYDCDLLVIGLRAHPGLIERLVPHTGRSITDRAPCSVLGVR